MKKPSKEALKMYSMAFKAAETFGPYSWECYILSRELEYLDRFGFDCLAGDIAVSIIGG